MNGEEIRKARKSRGWTQAELAERAAIAQAYLSTIELGTSIPSLPALERIAAALDLELEVTFKQPTPAPEVAA